MTRWVIMLTLGVVTLLMATAPAFAARITDIIDAADDNDDPFDFCLLIDFSQEFEWAKLTRERNVNNSIEKLMLSHNEFDIKSVKHQLDITGKFGLYHDLEFHFILPITLNQETDGKMSQHWRDKYWGGSYSPDDISVGGRPSLLTDYVFGFPAWNSVHRGFGDMIIGFSYAPLSEQRDPEYPNFVVTLDMQLPSGPEQNPKMEPSAANLLKGTGNGINVGEKLFAFIFDIKISKRAGIADPYFGIHYKLPIALSGLIQDPRHEGGILLGTELVAFERIPDNENNEPLWKVAFDLGLETTFFGRGQTFNELVDPAAWRRDKSNDANTNTTYWPNDPRRPQVFYYFDGQAPEYTLPIEDRFLEARGNVGFYAILYHYLQIRSGFTIAHRTEHYLSQAEKIDSTTLRPADMSGYYTQINEVGTRVKKERSLVIGYNISIGLTF